MTESRDGKLEPAVMSLEVVEGRSPSPASARRPLFRGSPPLAAKAALAAAVLVGIGAVVAPSAISASSFLSLLPFVAILAVASVGQHLVVQQRGLDISISGVICFAAVIVTKLPPANPTVGSVVF